MKSQLIGGPQLRARLASVAAAPKTMTQDWAEETRRGVEAVKGRPVGIWFDATHG